jgi:hypothetical protein
MYMEGMLKQGEQIKALLEKAQSSHCLVEPQQTIQDLLTVCLLQQELIEETIRLMRIY